MFSQCDNLESYIPYSYINEEDISVKTIRLRIHFIQKSKNDPANYTIADSAFFYNAITAINNSFYNNLAGPTLIKSRDIPNIKSTRVQFKIEGFYEHTDSVGWNARYYKIDSNFIYPIENLLSNPKLIVIQNNGIVKHKFNTRNKAQIIYNNKNILLEISRTETKGDYFFIHLKKEVDVKSLKGKIVPSIFVDKNCNTYNYTTHCKSNKTAINLIYTGATANKPGVGCGPSPFFLNMTNYNINREDWWTHAWLLAHEIGHCLGLYHTNTAQFDDFVSRERYGFINCDSVDVSNNLMGYNRCRNYLSPKQIGHIQRGYSSHSQRIRCTEEACNYDKTKSKKVRGNETWEIGKIVQGDIIIKKNAVLTVKCMLSMAPIANIYIEKGAKLIVDGGAITNNCNQKWGEIIYVKKYRVKPSKGFLWFKPKNKPYKKGQVEILNNGKITEGITTILN